MSDGGEGWATEINIHSISVEETNWLFTPNLAKEANTKLTSKQNVECKKFVFKLMTRRFHKDMKNDQLLCYRGVRNDKILIKKWK